MKRTASARKDRRLERTRSTLLEALLELIVEKGYDRTSVRDVLQRANVGRATFYAHFYNKQDLLLGRMTVFQLDVEGCVGPNGELLHMPDVTRILEHVASQHELYLALRGGEMLEAVLDIARRDLAASFEKLFGEMSSSGDAEMYKARYLAQYFTGAFLQLMIWWLDENMPETPETISRWFGQLGERVLGNAAGRGKHRQVGADGSMPIAKPRISGAGRAAKR